MDKDSGVEHFQNFVQFSIPIPSLYLLTAFFLLSGAALFLDLVVEEKTKKVKKTTNCKYVDGENDRRNSGGTLQQKETKNGSNGSNGKSASLA